MSAARFGLYLHFPYCLAKCPYCDFAVAVARELPEERYAKAVLAELELRLQAEPHLRGRPLESVFLGGGTPSLWHPRYVQRVLEGLHARLPLAPGLEVTLEANPTVADAERYAGYRAAGVNRLSLGVQSFQPETLKALGRDHDAAQAEGAFRKARAAGFPSVSLDFIYGVHGQSLAQARADAEHAAALEPEHLSTYALTVEREELAEDTPLAKQLARGQLHLPEDDVVVQMAAAVREAYARRGLSRYEVSNHARAGHESRHNALYWTGGEYLALGVGATGMLHAPGSGGLAGSRYTNLRSPEQYLRAVEAGRLPEASREALGARELFEERFAMALRLRSGVQWEPLLRAYGEDPAAREAELGRLVAHGLATLREGRLTLTDAGADVHSEVCARLI
ncbi:radical SAM family heme chaperone HemW [Aggregicoccus sp. 17bor-14]|nr:radical SAM family heme chaperone HemW [Simulacricoccus sp. 17bor-14]MRI90867.1 radical SAM family heme chaperone HemW [Aggregicoccus sp. 17bor-14]